MPSSSRRRSPSSPLLIVGLCSVLLAGACSSGSGTSGSTPQPAPPSSAADISGQTITVLLPPWANVPQPMLQQFTKETGVKVDFQVTGWDAIRNKVAIAGAGNTPLADVTEFDWSWTGQFGRAGWYAPLQNSLDPALVSDLQNNGAFSIGSDQYAVCYSNDFRISAYNTKAFSDAGIQQPPATFDELKTDLEAIKSKAVMDAPLTMPLSATEGTSTVWYLLTLAYGGNLFDASFKPAFTSPDSAGYKALQFMVDASKEGLVTPGAVSLTDSQSDNRYTSGTAAVTLAGGPDEMVTANDPKQSKIAGNAAFMLVPGETGPGNTFGLPEGLGIMSTSEHKDAALAFLKWWEEPSTLLALHKSLGLLPCRTSAVDQLVQGGKVVGGDTISEELKHIVPLFPQGAPPWYTQFSTKASTLINSAASGDTTVPDALQQLAAQATQLQAAG
jgi:multiple sugar transport system substrate-binding protein